MEFAVIMRATDSSSHSPQAQLALPKQTFQMLTAKQDPRIKAVYPFAGERAGVFIIDAASGEELEDLIGGLPISPLVTAEIHPVGTLEGWLKSIEQMEQQLAQAAPAGASPGS
jgi:muconolactone delta-isomerase